MVTGIIVSIVTQLILVTRMFNITINRKNTNNITDNIKSNCYNNKTDYKRLHDQ